MDGEYFDADEWLRSLWPSEWELSEPVVPYGEGYKRRNPVVEETFELASLIMDYCEILERTNRVFADQISAAARRWGPRYVKHKERRAWRTSSTK